MQITLRPDRTIEALQFEASPDRSYGLHLSTILRSIMCDLDPATYKQGGDFDWNRMQTGFAFERVLEQAFVSRREDIVRPGEFVLDGIACSPDGIDVNTWVLEEFKATWRSSREAPHGKKFWPWIVQMKCYCHVIEVTTKIPTDDARLRALFINGDYQNGYQPQYFEWDIKFSKREKAEAWNMVLSHARAKGMLR